MPRQDYTMAHFNLNRPYTNVGEFPALPEWPKLVKESTGGGINWRRQILFIKGTQASQAGYFLFRDTVSGGQPTVWSMWTISQKIGTPDEVKNLDNFLADAPGNKMADARQLEGDRFTAIGQFDVDIEYYVALPTDTPRATVRWGYSYIGGWPDPWHQYEDLLHLQLTGDGTYYVAFFPRRRNEPVPEFSTLGEGKIIKTEGDFGTDYGFLSANESEAAAESVSFKGTAGSVQNRKDGLVLSIGVKGKVLYKDYSLTSQAAASAEIVGNKVTISTSHDRSGSQTVTLGLPEGYNISSSKSKIQLSFVEKGRYNILIPDGVTGLTLDIESKNSKTQ